MNWIKYGWAILSNGFDIKAMVKEATDKYTDELIDNVGNEVKRLVDDPNSSADEDLERALETILKNEVDKLWAKI